MRKKNFHVKIVVSDYWIKIVDEEQRAHGLRKRSKASAKEQEERTAKKSAQKKKQLREKVKRVSKWILPLWGVFYVMLSSSFGRAEIRGSLFFFFFFPCSFFLPLGGRRSEVLCSFSYFIFFPFPLFLLAFTLRRWCDQRWCFFASQSVKLSSFFLHFSSPWRAKTKRGFLLRHKALNFLHPGFEFLHGMF